VLSLYFPAKKIEEVAEYLKMISSKDIDENMINDLNPLAREEATIQQGIISSSKYLEFGFKHISEAHKKNDFLVSIKDVTKEVEMTQQLRENEIKSEHEIQMMLSMLHVGPALLQDFMDGVETEIAIIGSILREDKKHANLRNAVEAIFRSVHSLKGNAALLDLKFLAEQANTFEEKMLHLRDQENLTWENFVPIAYELATLQEVIEKLRDLIKRIRLFQNKEGDSISALSTLPEAIFKLSQRIASETGKKVKLVAEDVNFKGVSNKYAYIIRDILVQLTRNAIMHGIETPEKRLRSGKSENGLISVIMKPDAANFCIWFRDDGRSFDFEAIRKKAVTMGKGDESAIALWDPSRLIKLTFEPGFSTSDITTLHSGRGMGMDIIKQRVKNLGGHMAVNFGIGQFTEFMFTVPLEQNKEEN
jgi:chemotaxis protein histidine kinase CheA